MRKKLLVVFAVLFMLTGCGSKVEMKDYFIYEINGTNGEGFLMGNLDVSNLTTDALDIKIDSFEDLFSEKAAEAMKFEMSIGYDVDKTSQLSNGDEITVNFTVSDEFKKKVGTSPLKIKVKDLD
ncbi:hypothetical protein [Globicatella sulfidifaciens]|uniref:Uncharacterized protein n=1 Tax=Globicatella sulfidifaciens TaxID=136093 RepID=A0A7X8C3Z1_9LACT|nr:hypothetical protein [Globicatella sulfidifaciens]NLJ18427.1 hypothetical protein [Globicatella sulfidifaciens]